MAWASLVVLCLGHQEAKAKLAALAKRRIKIRDGRLMVGKPRHARESLFTMGLRAASHWLRGHLDRPIQWQLTELDAPSWQHTWFAHQSQRYLLTQSTVRP